MNKGGLQIGRNEPCPCGSGKRYMDCCLTTKYLVNYNYKDEAVMVDKKQSLENLKEIMSINKWLGKLKRSKAPTTEFKIEDGFKALAKTYVLLNNSLKEVEQFASCSKGCSACCNREIEITYIESEYIKKYIENEFEQDKIQEIKTNIKDKSRSNRCIFLSDNEECIIYRARPVKCRTHIVFSHPDICKTGNNEQPLEYSDAILSIAENTVYKISKIFDTEKQKYKQKNIEMWF